MLYSFVGMSIVEQHWLTSVCLWLILDKETTMAAIEPNKKCWSLKISFNLKSCIFPLKLNLPLLTSAAPGLPNWPWRSHWTTTCWTTGWSRLWRARRRGRRGGQRERSRWEMSWSAFVAILAIFEMSSSNRAVFLAWLNSEPPLPCKTGIEAARQGKPEWLLNFTHKIWIMSEIRCLTLHDGLNTSYAW